MKNRPLNAKSPGPSRQSGRTPTPTADSFNIKDCQQDYFVKHRTNINGTAVLDSPRKSGFIGLLMDIKAMLS